MNGEEIILTVGSRNRVFALKDALMRAKIVCRVVATPQIAGASCGVSVAIRSVDYIPALAAAKNAGIKILSVYIKKAARPRSEYVKLQNLQ